MKKYLAQPKIEETPVSSPESGFNPLPPKQGKSRGMPEGNNQIHG